MKKSLKTLVVSLLSANLIVGSMATIVMAEEGGASDTPVVSSEPTGDENGGSTVVPPIVPDENPDESTGGGESDVDEDPNGSESTSTPESSQPESESSSDDESQSSESEESSSEESSESEESEEAPTESTPTYPETPSNTYVPPRTVARTAVPSSTSEESDTSIADQFDVSTNLDNLESLLVNSLEDPNFVLAWEDYQTLIADFDLTDISVNSTQVGSTFEEITANFTGNAVPEQITTEDGQNVLVFTYAGEESDAEATPAQIVLIGAEAGNVIGSSLLQASNAQSSVAPLSASAVTELVEQETTLLYDQDVYVTGLFQTLNNDVMYTTLVTPGETEGVNEFITIDKNFILKHNSIEETETSLLNQMQEEAATYLESLETVGDESDVSTDESSTTDETVVEESLEEDTNSSEFLDRFSPEGYESLNLLESGEITSGYEELLIMIDNGTLSVTEEQLNEIFGEPSNILSAGSSVYYDYYAVEDENIVLLELQTDIENNSVKTMRYDVRTTRLTENFNITVDGLFELASGELSIENLINTLGQANIVEHLFTNGLQTRYLWTSVTDPMIRNIEAYENNEDGSVELYYYDQE
ncbi:hypothetical protein ACTQ5R_07610 [Ruoffia tabacinasalis]|uniref:hypothetical protein n=1 Tax=Ruoffia tabacinasalis TaxID=87458 RepID=UPI003F970935